MLGVSVRHRVRRSDVVGRPEFSRPQRRPISLAVCFVVVVVAVRIFCESKPRHEEGAVRAAGGNSGRKKSEVIGGAADSRREHNTQRNEKQPTYLYHEATAAPPRRLAVVMID